MAPEPHDRCLAIAVGVEGSGKTYKIAQLARRARRAIIADPEGKWATRRGDQVVTSAAELFAALRAKKALDPKSRFRLVYRDSDIDVMADAAPKAAFAVRNVTLVVDELMWFAHAKVAKLGGKSRLPKSLALIFQVGRQRRINFLGTTREPQEIDPMLLTSAGGAGVLWFFKQAPGPALDVIAARWKQLAADLPGLEKRQFRTYGNEAVTALIGREGS